MAAAPPLLQLAGIHLTFGGTPLLEGAELAVSAGGRVALVGRNGSGKSTLLRIAAGLRQGGGYCPHCWGCGSTSFTCVQRLPLMHRQRRQSRRARPSD